MKAVCLLLSAGLFLGCRGSTCPAQVCCWCQMEQQWANTVKPDSWLSLTDRPEAGCSQGRRIVLLQLREGWNTSQGPGKVLVNPQIITFGKRFLLSRWIAAFAWMKQMIVTSDFFLFWTIWPHFYTLTTCLEHWAWIQSEFTSIPAASSLNWDASLVQEAGVRSRLSGWSENRLNRIKEGTPSHLEISRKSSDSNGNKGNTLLRLSSAFR